VNTAADALRDALERTGFRASLAPEYTAGHAPAAQHRPDPIPGEAATSSGISAIKQPDSAAAEPASYFGLPAIKKPEWTWTVPAYFFVGGTASGAYICATLADVWGGHWDHAYVRAGRWLALVGVILSVPLLVADLGRPERFLNMLRVFKPRSMMSTGSWALTAFGAFSALGVGVELLAALRPRARLRHGLIGPLRVLAWLGIVPALYVASYTGVLLSATNVPLWAGNRFLMGPLFFSSAMSCGLAATSLAARLFGPVRPSVDDRFKRAEQRVLTTELAITAASGLMLRGLARPLLTGQWSRLYQWGSLGTGLLMPLLLPRLGLRGGIWGAVSSVLVLIGGASTRLAVIEAGKESADDPHAYFTYTSAAAGP
jgi:formate-dependent nitrite reductase membrane component NrfD